MSSPARAVLSSEFSPCRLDLSPQCIFELNREKARGRCVHWEKEKGAIRTLHRAYSNRLHAPCLPRNFCLALSYTHTHIHIRFSSLNVCGRGMRLSFGSLFLCPASSPPSITACHFFAQLSNFHLEADLILHSNFRHSRCSPSLPPSTAPASRSLSARVFMTA